MRLKQRVQEFLRHDSGPLRAVLGYAGLAAGKLAWRAGKFELGLRIMTGVHSANLSGRVDDLIEAWLRAEVPSPNGNGTTLDNILNQFVRTYGLDGSLPPHLQDPRRMLGTRIMVVKAPGNREKGVVVLGYSYMFPLFARLFDVEAIANRYHIVLEPSWCGLCVREVLSFTRYSFPVFVECWEPKDLKFVQGIKSNLVAVPIGDNWWVDHRIFKPDSSVPKDIDVMMLAAWARFKRHRAFFKALRTLKRQGHRLRVALVGYPVDLTRDDVLREARALQVEDWLELHENLQPDQVARLLARSKVHVLWSRNEGANRAHVEAMFADVPNILRAGFNYGYRQPHMNPQTGAYAGEADLPDVLRTMVERYQTYAPRQWVLEHMSCQRATSILQDVIRECALRQGEQWSEGLAVKTVLVSTQRYWSPEDAGRFRADYAFLADHIRPE